MCFIPLQPHSTAQQSATQNVLINFVTSCATTGFNYRIFLLFRYFTHLHLGKNINYIYQKVFYKISMSTYALSEYNVLQRYLSTDIFNALPKNSIELVICFVFHLNIWKYSSIYTFTIFCYGCQTKTKTKSGLPISFCVSQNLCSFVWIEWNFLMENLTKNYF